MSEWGIALIAAGAAIAGSVVTGWYGRNAGIRQAEAARHAGDRQADAVLETVRRTLDEQAAVRVRDLRRQTYVRFLETAQAEIVAGRTGIGHAGGADALQRALVCVVLEGPDDVSRAAQDVADALRRHETPDHLERAKLAFVAAARSAMGAEPEGDGDRGRQ
jgi:hypothetical protein